MKRILVVEDDRTTQHLVTSILKSSGYEVTAVSDGAAALEELRRDHFDLVLTDIWMPQHERPGPAGRDAQAATSAARLWC